ncbi:ABC transporter substrate-binding protein [Streptomyces sp. NPDC050610]|uniref:ABC transporter substrate-binding protein n=1 Tax=Streptomyces sp. NPDC050610 TaxID=3157097 RepID=UPI003412C2BF
MRATTARGTIALLAAAALSLLSLTACGSGDPAAAGGARDAAGEAELPSANVVSGVSADRAAAALLPADVRARGTVKIAASVGSPPGSTYLKDGRTLAGLDIDISDAVAKKLRVRLQRQVAGFEAILPALGSGKYDVGTGNFGVTEARRKTIDFVTYINDGQGFAALDGGGPKKVTDLTELCGLTVATGAGTTFEATLEENAHRCADAGKKAYRVKTFADPATVWLGLRQGRVDVVMSTANGLRYAVRQQQGVRFLNESHRLDVGFAFPKGSRLAPAFRAAVEGLISDGSYARILKKWGVGPSAIRHSQLSPPELKW